MIWSQSESIIGENIELAKPITCSHQKQFEYFSDFKDSINYYSCFNYIWKTKHIYLEIVELRNTRI